ncbi:MAG: divergent polysaccharide deacetylase family protein [Deltaproteobacteria bacterium]|nr:divergent polysaccharide deacetylase family protein [Deltaproteobacteria bacterium]
MRVKERKPKVSRGWLGLALGIAGAALFFFLGYLLAERRFSEVLPAPGSRVSPELFQETRPRVRNELETALGRLLQKINLSRAAQVNRQYWQLMHSGALEWSQLRFDGVCLEPELLRLVLQSAKEFLGRDFALRLLFSYDKEGGISSLLLLDGEHVVAVGTFITARSLVEPGPQRPRLAVVIDDLGLSLSSAAEFAAISLPLTFAVLPRLENSRRVAEYLLERRCDIILHLPMEPRDYPDVDPGPGALFCAMDEKQLRSVLLENLASVPGIIGVNNHMGSRLTANPVKMKMVMRALRDRDLFFLDSLTIAGSCAYEEAQAAGIPALRRDVFLDNLRDEQHILLQLQTLLTVAEIRGTAIGIGHPYAETAAALKKFNRMAEQAGVEIVALRRLFVQSLKSID